MAELMNSVQEMLKEETWTRAAISNYTKEKLVELSGIIEKAREENCLSELKEICDEQLSHSRESIIALYISGMISLKEGILDESSLRELVDIFQKNHKENVVEYICQTIIDEDGNNIFALRTLAEAYRAENKDEVWDFYKKIVKLDFEEADLAKALGEHFEETDKETAVEYYKKAILRYTNVKNINAIKELWTKLIELIPEEVDFFQLVKRKIAKTLGEDKTAVLLQELYTKYKAMAPEELKYWDIAIGLLKEILHIDNGDIWARRELVDCYKNKYEGHSHLDDYIRSSDLTANYRNVFEAINDFEKHIAFDEKSYVFHKTWGVGQIGKVSDDKLYIWFGKTAPSKKDPKKKTKVYDTMSLKMAVSALTPLENDHIWVLKAKKVVEVLDKNGTPVLDGKTGKPLTVPLKEKIKDDKAWALRTIIKSFGNSCDFKKIKAELVPSVLTAGEWTSWNSSAKRILETDSSFGVNPNDISQYIIVNDITPEQKLANEFKAQKHFFARIDILMKYVNKDETDKTNDLFAEMFSYFVGYVKTLESEEIFPKVNEQILASYLVVQNVSAQIKELAYKPSVTFQQIYSKIEDPREMYLTLKDTKNTTLRHDFLANIKMLPNWADEYIRLFPTVLSGEMISHLLNNNQEEKLQNLAVTAFENCRDYRNAVLYFFKECQDAEWFKNAGIPYERQIIALVQLIQLAYREITNHVNSTDNKKIIENATNLLFGKDRIFDYMFSSDEDTVKRIYTLIDDAEGLEPNFKALMRNRILEKYPDFKFHVTEEKSAAPKGMLVTSAKLEEKKALLDDLQTVQIPQNAQEIDEARAKGDLKENAEYKAAKEHQHYLNTQVAKLTSELNRAVIFDPTTITTAIVSFATVVTLHNNKDDKDETYTVLGPWESDPDNGIISYMAPFGNAIMNAKVGENLKFNINEYSYDYTVKSIKAAKI